MTLTISKFRRLLPVFAVAVLTVACAPLTVPPKAEYPVGRARLVLPPGAWQDLGTSDEAIAGPGGRTSLQTRDVGLRGAKGEWLAALRVQTNRTGDLRGSPQGGGYCPAQQDVIVKDPADGSPVRADCLRFKLWASSPKWLEKNRPDLVQWMASRQIALNAPYAHVGYRYVTEAGVWVVVDALVDQRLISVRPRNNEEFLVAGLPFQQWAHDLAQAVRLSAGMVDGHLAIPPFPFAEAASRK
ncbi:hypothetical protein ASE39_07965 [Acidovorax sp. Root267]|uniref:hypothetical protein n=1 Tax=Acidovorax sp. Root267 TaxID=1736505 RepID=UPI00070E5130|nr:hypothetical protein [Acidovorax sp. Root267]KRD22287.1 hypothetical protein ASE39_07965 [Acidovorax sp. Root267]